MWAVPRRRDGLTPSGGRITEAPPSTSFRRAPMADIQIPDDLKPADGRFGCGPSKVRPEAVDALARVSTSLLGTSHRQKPDPDQVARLRRGLAELFTLPAGYEALLGNG